MPKMRGIKPDFWTDIDIIDLSIPARLLFIGMWNFACDNGHLADKPKQIKMRILPGDDVNAESLLEELVTCGRITREGGVITIHNFARHQKPNRRWWVICDLPTCVVPEDRGRVSRSGDGGTVPFQQLATRSPTLDNVGQQETKVVQHAFGDVDGDVDGEGEERSRARKRATAIDRNWLPDAEVRQAIATELPDVDLKTEHAKFVDHFTANGKTMKDWTAAWRNWMRRSTEFGPAARRQSVVSPAANAPIIPPEDLVGAWDTGIDS